MVYLYDGSYAALLTAVFYVFKDKQYDANIVSLRDIPNMTFFGMQPVFAEDDKVERVLTGCRNKISPQFLSDIYYIYLSDLPQSATAIKNYIRDGLRYGKYVYQYLHLPSVNEAMKIIRRVSGENHRMKGLVRFSKYEDMYYSDITPDHNILPIIYKHFERRMPNEKWIIRDLVRNLAAVHFDSSTIVTEIENFATPDKCADEIETAWRTFYESIAIPERKNEKLRRNMMPKRYWQNMTEFATG